MKKTILHTKDFVDLNDILFNRPISKLYQKNIAIFLQKNSALKIINDFYEIVNVFSHHPVLVAEKNDLVTKLDVELFLESNAKNSTFLNTDDCVQISNNVSYSVIGLDSELSSKWQLLYEGLLKSHLNRLVFTNKTYKIINFSVQSSLRRSDDILVFNLKEYLSILKNNDIITSIPQYLSVDKKIEILQTIASRTNSNCVLLEHDQVIAVSYKEPYRAMIANSTREKDKIYDLRFVAILICLMSDVNAEAKKFIQLSAAAAKIYKNSLKNDKFNFKILKRLI